jgi:CRISPR-associated protein Cas1
MAESADLEALPSLVPARMVNEYCYCPRLFFLEWAQARFEDNADTVEGQWAHRRVDKPSGDLGGQGDAPAVERSVLLSSERLGVVAKADLIEEGPTGTVVPVDYKKGRPPANEQRSWEPERVQLCVMGLLLREQGFSVTRGVLYFTEARQRVQVDFDEQLEQRTLALLEDLRTCASSPSPPPPLVDSPKCPRCSLVGICLPDETNALAERSARKPRRLVPSSDDAKPLHVTEQGARAGLDKGRIVIKKDAEELASVRMIDISEVCLHGNVQISSQLLRALLLQDVAVSFFGYGGQFVGMATGMPSRHVELRRRQALVATSGHLNIARYMVEGKIRNCRTLLRRNARSQTTSIEQLGELANRAVQAPSTASLLGVEGTAARLYFAEFSKMLGSAAIVPGGTFDFEGRNRRPPKDPVNCLLSFGYALLTRQLTIVALRVGFDPYMGVYHRPRFGRPALALDLTEEFRALLVDSTVVRVINNQQIRPGHFTRRTPGVALTADGRRAFIEAFESRLDVEIMHPVFGYKISYRRVLEIQARLLGAVLLGELDSYPPFVTR